MFINKAELDILGSYFNKDGAITLYIYSSLTDKLRDFSERLNGLFDGMQKDIAGRPYSRAMHKNSQSVLSAKEILLEDFVENKQKTFCVFIAEDFCRHFEIPIKINDQITVAEKFHTSPLFLAVEQLERFAVLIYDRKKARLYNYFAGKIKEEAFLWHDYGLSNIKSASKKGKTAENRMEENFHHHLTAISDLLFRDYKKHSFDKVIIGAHKGEVNMIKGYMHSYIMQDLAGEFIGDPDDSESDILKKTTEVVNAYRREVENAKLKELFVMHTHDKAVHGLNDVLHQLRMDNIRELVIASDFHAEGYMCPKRHILDLLPEPDGKCPYCQSELIKEHFLEDELQEEVLLRKGKIVHILHYPELVGVHKIGAFLRHSQK